MFTTVHALVVRDVDYKEYDKILTVVTPEEGKISVSARQARRRGNPHAAAAQLLCCSKMLLSEYKDRLTIKESQVIDCFWPLRQDIGRLSLGAYIAEVAETLMPPASPCPEIFRLTLLALNLLSKNKYPMALVKAAYEMAVLCRAGFTPALDGCSKCGTETLRSMRIDISAGVLFCPSCALKDLPTLSPGVLDALFYIRQASARNVYKFTLEDSELNNLAEICQAYMIAQTGKKFTSLDFYDQLLPMSLRQKAPLK
ncbi:MAG: DNA repair protein RecO [Oscillospiraceae bacterium]|nr:DNA repair protein RecO [Oscillospiraceae bacterium]